MIQFAVLHALSLFLMSSNPLDNTLRISARFVQRLLRRPRAHNPSVSERVAFLIRDCCSPISGGCSRTIPRHAA